jgi:hypothetical protein
LKLNRDEAKKEVFWWKEVLRGDNAEEYNYPNIRYFQPHGS